ncbi:MurR/RpiR family transcriptional regulator [Mycoplasma sp. 480]|uniref:MurR/RpiR family transcriptional regulator n=1 Tax=Mycoplasma sp. 480 TaxID=3440155 RepID=UPI003F5196C6
MTNNILTKINSLTNVELKILEFINLFHEKEFDLTQQELSQIIYCSEASISRFAKKYGFNNYRALTIFINKRIKELDILDISTKFLKTEKNFLNIYKTQQYAINSAVQKENIYKIKLATNYLNKAKKVLLFGLGSSGKILSEFCANLKKIGFDATFELDFHTMFPLLGTLEKDDAIICLSNNFRNNEIYFALKKAKEFGAKTIVITSNIEKIFSELIDIKITYAKINNLDKLVPIASKISHLVILDYFFDYITNSNQKYKQKLINTNNVLNSWQDFLKKER